MENSSSHEKGTVHETEFKRFAAKRVIAGALIMIAVIWVVGILLGHFEKPHEANVAYQPESVVEQLPPTTHSEPMIDNTGKPVGVVKTEEVMHLAQKESEQAVERGPSPTHEAAAEAVERGPAPTHEAAAEAVEHGPAPLHETAAEVVGHAPAPVQKESSEPLAHGPAPAHTAEVKKPEHPVPVPPEEKAAPGHEVTPHEAAGVPETKPKAKGVAFVEATIKPLDYELNERFYGWRTNDILDFTDNVNSFQLGVLEVTRRTVVALTERISRTGATAAFDKNLENSMNWFMVKPDRYWFPSPESKYKAGLHELIIYKEKLERGEANFYTRPDNLIPLLMAYEDLLGSCEENLVKTKEDDGSTVSFFKADDYFYYAQGIASAMGTILEAVQKDFLITVETRRGVEVLHHAIESCHHAAEIHPWLITNSSLSGVLANHRANLAAPMSHARFYIGVLIKTLST